MSYSEYHQVQTELGDPCPFPHDRCWVRVHELSVDVYLLVWLLSSSNPSVQSLEGVWRSEDLPTATYCVMLDHQGEFHFGVGDMDITSQVSVEWVSHVTLTGQSCDLGSHDGWIVLCYCIFFFAD